MDAGVGEKSDGKLFSVGWTARIFSVGVPWAGTLMSWFGTGTDAGVTGEMFSAGMEISTDVSNPPLNFPPAASNREGSRGRIAGASAKLLDTSLVRKSFMR